MELFRKKDSQFWWFDFKVRDKRERGSTKETNIKRVEKVAALKLSQAIEGTDPLDRKAPSLQQFSTWFLNWVEVVKLTAQTKRYYRDGWRLLSKTKLVGMRLDRISKDDAETLNFDGRRQTRTVRCAPCDECSIRRRNGTSSFQLKISSSALTQDLVLASLDRNRLVSFRLAELCFVYEQPDAIFSKLCRLQCEIACPSNAINSSSPFIGSDLWAFAQSTASPSIVNASSGEFMFRNRWRSSVDTGGESKTCM